MQYQLVMMKECQHRTTSYRWFRCKMLKKETHKKQRLRFSEHKSHEVFRFTVSLFLGLYTSRLNARLCYRVNFGTLFVLASH